VRGRPLYLVSETRGFERSIRNGSQPPMDHVVAIREDPSQDLPSLPPR
jgi:hypothetical protein